MHTIQHQSKSQVVKSKKLKLVLENLKLHQLCSKVEKLGGITKTQFFNVANVSKFLDMSDAWVVIHMVKSVITMAFDIEQCRH